MHIHTKYEVSILNPVARRLCTDANDADADTNNCARQTNHDYIGSFGRIPNEPKTDSHLTQIHQISFTLELSLDSLLRI